MPIVTWTEKYSVKVDQIDTQHKKLVDMLNRLFDSLLTGQAHAQMGTLFSSLANYTKTHFADEERLLKESKYPNFAMHKGEHDRLIKQIDELMKKSQKGEVTITRELMEFLRGWLTNHILKTDMAYSAHVQRHLSAVHA